MRSTTLLYRLSVSVKAVLLCFLFFASAASASAQTNTQDVYLSKGQTEAGYISADMRLDILRYAHTAYKDVSISAASTLQKLTVNQANHALWTDMLRNISANEILYVISQFQEVKLTEADVRNAIKIATLKTQS